MTDLRPRLAAAIDAAVGESLVRAWVWGQWDCAMACARVLEGALGYDPAARWRGRYSTPRGFMRVLKRDGYVCLQGALASVAVERRWREIAPEEAAKGDVGVAEARGLQSCVLNWTPGYWLGFRDAGHGFVPSGAIVKAWSIA
jgi:hypothetical protein